MKLLGISLTTFLLLTQAEGKSYPRIKQRPEETPKFDNKSKKRFDLFKPQLESQGFGKSSTIFSWVDTPCWSYFIQETDGNINTNEYYYDNRKVQFTISTNSDLELWLDWERDDILEQDWYIDRFDIHTFLQFTVNIYLDTSFFYWDLDLPLRLFDASIFDFYWMVFPEGENVYCFGANQYLDLVNLSPVLRENDFDCTYSLLRLYKDEMPFVNYLGWMYNFDCQGATTQGGLLTEMFTGIQYIVTNGPFFNYELINETIVDYPWFGIQLYEWYRDLFRYCRYQGQWLNLKS